MTIIDSCADPTVSTMTFTPQDSSISEFIKGSTNVQQLLKTATLTFNDSFNDRFYTATEYDLLSDTETPICPITLTNVQASKPAFNAAFNDFTTDGPQGTIMITDEYLPDTTADTTAVAEVLQVTFDVE